MRCELLAGGDDEDAEPRASSSAGAGVATVADGAQPRRRGTQWRPLVDLPPPLQGDQVGERPCATSGEAGG
jgi:hypothetical protein